LYKNNKIRHRSLFYSGFTLIELMVVMAIVGLLMTMVGPLAINTVEKANAKQEMLTMKNWFRKISYRAYSTGSSYQLNLSGKKAELFIINDDEQQIQPAIITKTLDSLFFQPQILYYNAKGFVSPTLVEGTYRNKVLKLDLSEWVNGVLKGVGDK